MRLSEVKTVVIEAFRGVSLGRGCSLRSAEQADNDDWTAISVETLDHFPHLAHMDAEGFRYYIPAFMLSLIDDYDRGERGICTMSALRPGRDDLWE